MSDTFGRSLKVLVLLVGVLHGWAVPSVSAQDPDEPVRYFQLLDAEDPREQYLKAVLEACLGRAGITAPLQRIHTGMSQDRALHLLNQGGMDIVLTMTSTKREVTNKPVRVPVFRGLFGMRLLLTRQGDTRFHRDLPLDSLRAMRVSQGHDWPDAKILAANGFNVVRTQGYPPMFHLLARGRVDFFAGSVLEVNAERERFKDLDLALERDLMLRYPAVMYFFVNPERTEVVKALEEGMSALVADGTLDALLERYLGDVIRATNLNSRRVIELENPLLPSLPASPGDSWWYSAR